MGGIVMNRRIKKKQITQRVNFHINNNFSKVLEYLLKSADDILLSDKDLYNVQIFNISFGVALNKYYMFYNREIYHKNNYIFAIIYKASSEDEIDFITFDNFYFTYTDVIQLLKYLDKGGEL